MVQKKLKETIRQNKSKILKWHGACFIAQNNSIKKRKHVNTTKK